MIEDTARQAEDAIAESLRLRGTVTSDAVFDARVEQTTRGLYEPLVDAQLSSSRMEQLVGWLETLEEEGVRVVVIDIPTFRMAEFFDDAVVEGHARFLDRLGESHLVVRGGPELTSQHFRNLDHMNSDGARRYTAWLLEVLGDHDIVPASGQTVPIPMKRGSR